MVHFLRLIIFSLVLVFLRTSSFHITSWGSKLYSRFPLLMFDEYSSLTIGSVDYLNPDQLPNILCQIKRNASQFTIFLSAIEKFDLEPTLQSKGPITIFAPTDTAFYEEYGKSYNTNNTTPTLDFFDSSESGRSLKDIVLYHILNSEISKANIKRTRMAMTYNGNFVMLSTRYRCITYPNPNII